MLFRGIELGCDPNGVFIKVYVGHVLVERELGET